MLYLQENSLIDDTLYVFLSSQASCWRALLVLQMYHFRLTGCPRRAHIVVLSGLTLIDWRSQEETVRPSRYHQSIHGCQEQNCSEVRWFRGWEWGGGEAKDVCERGEITRQRSFSCVFLAQRIWYAAFYPDARNSVVFFVHIVATQKNIFNRRL